MDFTFRYQLRSLVPITLPWITSSSGGTYGLISLFGTDLEFNRMRNLHKGIR